MKALKLSFVVVIFLIEFHYTLTNPLRDPNICGRPTCTGDGKFKYNAETIYKYSVDVRSLFNGTSKNESQLSIEGTAYLEFISKCDGRLTLTDLTLTEGGIPHNQSEAFSQAISAFSLRFSFHDGIISEICPSDDEPNYVLNFKKGLLSMLHNTMKRFDLDYDTIEEDVHGRCKTNYTVLGARQTALIIEKTKDLSTCSSHAKLHSMVQATPYNFRPDMQGGANLLKSSSKCEISIDHNIYNGVTCEESYVLEPFSHHDSGATTVVKHSLVLVKEHNDTEITEPKEITRRVPLLFDHVPSPTPTHDEIQAAKHMIKTMCRLSLDDVRIEFSDLFTKFVQTLRLLSTSAFEELYENSATTCPTGRKHMLSALPYVGSTASVLVMKNVILRQGSLSESTVNEWLLSMSFISIPDEEMMKAAAELLQFQSHYQSSISLAVGALTHTYCTQHANCRNNAAVNGILQHLEDEITKLYHDDTRQRTTHDNIMAALKSLGNVGISSESFKGQLIKIIEDEGIDIGIRIAAVECHRRMPCDQSRVYFEELYRNQSHRAELRISAYLQVMRCPNYLLIRTIRHTLEVEEVNQVGSFVWTHLSNLLKSSIPSRVEIQGLLSDKDLVKKFSSDVRKFSHNREGSLFFEEYNVGANYENNVIFSSDSYIPRSSMLNLTVDLFGQSINVFELYGRAEGFEDYIESMFGPNGPLSAQKLAKKLPKMRFSRSTENNEVLEQQIEELPNVINNNFNQPKLAMGYKVFGNDLKYFSLDGYEEIGEAVQFLNPMYHLQKLLQGKEINYNKAAMFLDTTYVVPTGAGLPMKIAAVGTSSVNLKLFGSLDLTNFSKAKELELKADIRPSVSLDITGSMSVDAFFVSTGVKLKTSVYTSSAVEGHVKLQGPKLLSVKFSIPRQTSEIFGAKSELLVVQHDIEEKQSGFKDHSVSKSICSLQAVDKTVGLKLCADYHFTNVTKINNAPYFLLAGPAGFRLFLQKSDPTAKIYLFEYKWTDKKSSSVISLTFDTPGSALRRLVGLNLTLDRQSQNLTLLLQSSAGTVLAKGRYKNSPNEKYLQLALDINNVKHFDSSISLKREFVDNGAIYYPKFYLGINSERVMEIQGSVKSVSKKGISQYDLDLKFQTKRITSKLFGYISKTEASIATNLHLFYKFANAKEQGVHLDFYIANRSKRNIMDIRGSATLESTAYPHFNFNSNLKMQKGMGHTECSFEVTSNHKDVEEERLKFEVHFTHKSLKDSTKILNTVISITRPAKNLNLKADLTYRTKNPETNVILLVNYGVDKKFSINFFLSRPKTALEHIETHLNITLPTFTPMVIKVKIHEQKPSEYMLQFSGTWFSGHSLSARGLYQDKSTNRNTDHHLKLLLNSPSFLDVLTNIQYFRDNNVIRISAMAEHNNLEYSILFKHTVITARKSEKETATLAELKYRTKLYSLSSSSYSGDHRRLSVELHIDQIRDIHFAIYGYNKEKYKAAGIEMKWDANRDPQQKLILSGNFTKIQSFNYEANLLLSYPGRTVLGNFDFLMKHGHFNTLMRFSWDDDQSFAFGLTSDYQFDDKLFVIVSSKIITPFEDWKRTLIDTGFHHNDNMYQMNGSISWQNNQHVSIDLFGDYSVQNSSMECEYRSVLSSTLKHIPSLSATLSHRQNDSRLDTLLRLMYDPQEVISVVSNWQIDMDSSMKNLTGNVVLSTPFNGFNAGHLISRIVWTKTKYLRGVAELDLDLKKFVVSVEGKLQKITNSMLVANITTPIEKYKHLQARLGFSEEKRHLVAQIVHPNGDLGIEALLSVNSLLDFDTKFSLGTPLSVLQRVLLVGKLKSDTADFRAGWNLLLGGFTGVWHYDNVVDFEYSYKIYTPLQGFEENSIVIKLIFDEGLDLEASARLAIHKLGIKVLGEPKPPILRELGIKTDDIYGSKQSKYEDEEEEEEDDEPLNWTGLMEIDALVYPTIKGTLDLDQKGPLYTVLARLTLPNGVAELVDQCEYHDVFTMRNKLLVTTPFDSYKTITSNYILTVIPGHKYFLEANVDYLNRTQLIKGGVFAEYFVTGEKTEKSHNVTLLVATPFSSFPRLDIRTSLGIQKNIYNANLSVATNSSNLSLSGNVKIDNSFVDTAVYLHANTPSISVPPVYLTYTRISGDEGHVATVRLNVPKKMSRDVLFEGSWQFISFKQFHCHVKLESPFKGMEKSIAGIKVFAGKENSKALLVLNMHPLEVEVNTTSTEDSVYSNASLTFNNKKFPVLLTCNMLRVSPTERQLEGNLWLREKPFKVTGKIDYIQEIPMETKIKLIPEDGSDPVELEYKVTPSENNYVVTASAKHQQKFIVIKADATVKNLYDWDMKTKIETSHKTYKIFAVDAKSTTDIKGTRVDIMATTPIHQLETVNLGASIQQSASPKMAHAYFVMSEIQKGNLDVEWTFKYLEDMNLKLVGFYKNKQYDSTTTANLFYANPEKAFKFLQLGGDVHVNPIWSAASNFTLHLPNYQNISTEANLQLPPPSQETHSAKAKLAYTNQLSHVDYLASYKTVLSKKSYGSNGIIDISNNEGNTKIIGNMDVDWQNKLVKNILDFENRQYMQYNLKYKLQTPKYENQNYLILNAGYKKDQKYHNVTCDVFQPENRLLGSAKVDFSELANMNGTVNVTIPYRDVNYTGVNFATETSGHVYNRYLQVFWPNNTALLEGKCDIKAGSTLLERLRNGTLIIEIPLATRHMANVNYSYEEKPQLSVGQAALDYNGNRWLDAAYNCLSESRAGFDKDTIHVELRNKLVPIGADYVHGYEYGAPGEAPSVDTKHLNVYDLKNHTKFNVTGELKVASASNGQQIELTAVHYNRTVKLKSDYSIQDQRFMQHSKLELGPALWIEYHLDLLNKTMNEQFDSQQIQIDVLYPKRNFSAVASYEIGETSISTDVSLKSDTGKKTVEGGLDWKRTSENSEELKLILKHPTFEKDVTIFGQYEFGDKTLLDAQIKVDYANDPEHLFILRGKLDDNNKQSIYNYTYNIVAIHNATNLNLDSYGGVYWTPSVYTTSHYSEYKRSYLPLQKTEALARINFLNNEIQLKKDFLEVLSSLYGRCQGSFPLYTANISTTYNENNATGTFLIDVEQKLIELELNMSTDGSESLHMYGEVPDARSAQFDVWRNYDDIRVSDVTYFLKMNHSRLIMSKLNLRPDLIYDIQTLLRTTAQSLYRDILDNINNTRQYLRSEINDSLFGIWEDAKPITVGFYNDLRGLSVIEEDIEELKLFLNESYYNNDFYIKDITEMTMLAFDELKIKAQFESLPAIIKEIVEIMGETGQKVQKSIKWVIDKIKTYYKNTTDFIRQLLEGDPVTHLSGAFKNIIEQFDDFLRKMHVAFLQYMEQLWQQTYEVLVSNWHKMLAAVEPTFLKLIHYLESIVWNTSKEFLDFLYIRKSEILESPYFAKFSKFTHDLDKFYKDITGRNTISNVIKYAKIAWNFLREKYLNMMPFGKELQQIVSEILGEINELRNLPSIRYLEAKYLELYGKLKWFYNYYDMEARLQKVISMVHQKLTDMSLTALQAENRYREAKTKFIFEPSEGIMLLEQKLPMSWHAFNETPKFQEIPELKVVYDLQNYFVTSQTSFWNFYYDYKPYTDPSDWIPPYKAQALLVGSRYYVTFDRRYFDFQGKCSYLLASDFLTRNFSLVVSYGENPNTHDLLLILNKTVVEINVFEDVVKIRESASSQLPIQIGDTFIYRNADVVTVDSASGFLLECNMKFDVCTFEVSGWYFGRTAGLLGTINNEPSDDLLGSNNHNYKRDEIDEFTKTWSLGKECDSTKDISANKPSKVLSNIRVLCEEMFNNKVSEFSSCFPRVAKDPFLSMCMNSTSEEEACTSAVAYITLCGYSNTPLRIPDSCVKCTMPNGTSVAEGQFVRLEGNDVQHSTDVVFIVEAKECNKDLKTAKNIESLVEILDKEFMEAKITNNRYSMVLFGGDGVYNEPKSRSVNGKVFGSAHNISSYFDNIPVGKGNEDLFGALTFATKLPFRAGVSKTFVLFPCSGCDEAKLTLDYAILHSLLFEGDIKLHILMNEEFSLQKKTDKNLFGIDSTRAYSKKDIRTLKGDAELRKKVKLPKDTIGLCMPLALESNGSLFTAKLLEGANKNSITKFINVFAKRLAYSAEPSKCVDCECTAPSSGVSYMECYPCTYPSKGTLDYGFDENEMLASLQPGEDF